MSSRSGKVYWRSIGEGRPSSDAGAERELAPKGTEDVGRREFLRLVGFGVGAASLAACSRGPEHRVLPYLVRPEEITPGLAYWYASVCGACAAGCGILAKGRDGRPIKLEGNPDHPLSRGGMCAIGQASVLALYDSQRLHQPLRGAEPASWPEVDGEIGRQLDALRGTGRVRFLTDSVTGPTEREQIAAFLTRFADGRLVTYDSLSCSAIAEAHRQTHGVRVVPRYRFERAQVIVGIDADFLGNWISPVEYTAGYRAGRQLEENGRRFSHHVQFESRMSLTGSNADRRLVVPAGAAAHVLAQLAGELALRAGLRPPWSSLPDGPVDSEQVATVADRLWSGPRGKTLVVCGQNDAKAQRLVNYVNHLLGNYGSGADGTTVDLASTSTQRRGDDAELATLIDELEAGQVDALFVRGVNPLYELPDAPRLAAALERVGLTVSFASHEDETAQQAGYVCPEPHFLESWGDAEPVTGVTAIRQPTIRAIGSTRPLLESLAAWSGSTASAYEQLRDAWQRNVYPRRESGASFEEFWNQALHDGYARVGGNRGGSAPAPAGFDLSVVVAPAVWHAPAADELLLELHPAAGVLDGRHALNPWLQEMPDPIAKTVWDNFAAIGAGVAERLNLATGDVVRVIPAAGEDPAVELPVLVQPGQHDGTVAIALGYGRAGTDRFTDIGPQWWEARPTVEPGEFVGANAAPLLAWNAEMLGYGGRAVRLESTDRRHELVSTQRHNSLTVPARLSGGDHHPRPIVQETTLAEWREDPAAGGHGHHDLATLWPDHPKQPHHWGLAIDLTACTGCSACVVSCQAENNIPVVGKDEVRRSREMHWMRIDRYYSGEAAGDVSVVHMPMLCQHCDNAPCETVCPVQATAQSAEGLNQQVYNRCVGTRYCANNCPYKVRRFNWFEHAREDRVQNLMLNPDVTVRSRGVMEKCSLCVQRIHDAKMEARRAGRPVADGEIQPACAQSCPADAIVFGDMNDPASALSRHKHDPRHFAVLAELGIRPVVGYMTLVRNLRQV